MIEKLHGKAIPVVRTDREDTARRLVDWLGEAGMTIFEITTSVPNHTAIVRDLAREMDLLVGMGTVLDAETAEAAVAAGAAFLVSPCVVPEVIAVGRAAGVPVIPGAATPTEALTAHRAGAAAVKLFPSRQLGGPGFLKAVASVLPTVSLVPTGGIEIDDAGDYFAAGAFAIGLGSQLAKESEIESGDKAAVIERARRLAAYT
ncbi:bifunctional 4-hydroxy-2-oxoglutarate aldolase/2-dehydro-3-deoxy-phosphogluconate aldolase [Amorphus orientalis]|uniref:2-dehydro-3-deoxyphosphogluconate aldolase/(4S)-4-hydroxy-2-oxoglutarate aldolase n=1 Tax=Amorphus orientalis TaxID=649198 RepID=A0AAE3VMQ9_9HYPH|nr:bifunctional 4-hydroxy-2-oxoglutarate aldolase/2-dehydro-3-deoxy-phosphogluconate aldolase [Amorphus orientalis]MDQ0314526.1 2-dehydro-3-deoxyphosphogluconate aldolase/(4S)-4-hydroxy-2-oxoglutarate aldolase [Amorphus orientalis]